MTSLMTEAIRTLIKRDRHDAIAKRRFIDLSETRLTAAPEGWSAG